MLLRAPLSLDPQLAGFVVLSLLPMVLGWPFPAEFPLGVLMSGTEGTADGEGVERSVLPWPTP